LTEDMSYIIYFHFGLPLPGYAQIPSLHSCHEEPNECFQVHVSPFLLHFPYYTHKEMALLLPDYM